MKREQKAKIKILLVDDHPIVRAGIKASLLEQEHFEVIGEAANGVEAIEKVKKFLPDIVLMDISMPQMSGLEATKVLRDTLPKVKVIALTMHDNKDYIVEIIRLGARGYVLKDSAPSDLARAIESVYSNDAFFSPALSQIVLNEYVKQAVRIEKSLIPELSEREREVLALIADGHSNKQIADQLYVSVRTVETHREHIMKKLDIHSAAGLTKYAIENGIVGVK